MSQVIPSGEATNFNVVILYNGQSKQRTHVPVIMVARTADEIMRAAQTINAEGLVCVGYDSGARVTGKNGLTGIRYATSSCDDIVLMGILDGVKPVNDPSLQVGAFGFGWHEFQRAVDSFDPASLEVRVESP